MFWPKKYFNLGNYKNFDLKYTKGILYLIIWTYLYNYVVLDVVSDNAGIAGVVEHGEGGIHRRTDERRFRPVRRRFALRENIDRALKGQCHKIFETFF